MLESIEVLLGSKEPSGIRLPLVRRSDDSDPPDFTQATAARFVVRQESNGLEVEWTATLSALTSDSAFGTYIFAPEGTDTAKETRYILTPWVTINGVGERPCQPIYLVVTRTPTPVD
jgi:hypothetical protein